MSSFIYLVRSKNVDILRYALVIAPFRLLQAPFTAIRNSAKTVLTKNSLYFIKILNAIDIDTSDFKSVIYCFMEILFFSVAILSLLIDAIIAYQTLAPMFGFDLILFEKFDLALVQSLSIISNYLIGSALVFASLIGTLHLVGISDQNKKMKIFFFTWGIILLIATTFTLIMLANARYLASLVAESDVVDYNTLNRINIYNHYIYMGFTFASIMTNCIAVLAFRNGSIIMGSSILWLLIALVFVLIWAVSVLINIIINAIFIFFVSIFWLLVTLVGGKRDENHEELQDIHAGNNSEIENNKNNPQNENVNNENEYDDSSLEESEDQLLEISDETDNEDQELKWDPF